VRPATVERLAWATGYGRESGLGHVHRSSVIRRPMVDINVHPTQQIFKLITASLNQNAYLSIEGAVDLLIQHYHLRHPGKHRIMHKLNSGQNHR